MAANIATWIVSAFAVGGVILRPFRVYLFLTGRTRLAEVARRNRLFPAPLRECNDLARNCILYFSLASEPCRRPCLARLSFCMPLLAKFSSWLKKQPRIYARVMRSRR